MCQFWNLNILNGRVNARRTEYQLSVSVYTYPFLFENGDFFPLVWRNRPHVFSENGQLKLIFSNTLFSQSGDFENAGHSFTGGRTGERMFSNTMMQYIIYC